MCKKGDIVLIPFPFTDLSGQKNRPALILASSEKGEDVIVAFISSRAEKPHPFDVFLKEGSGSFTETGLKTSSLIKVNKIATLEKKIILGELGHLEGDVQKEVTKKLRVLFGI